jgi:hypothetical protein
VLSDIFSQVLPYCYCNACARAKKVGSLVENILGESPDSTHLDELQESINDLQLAR